jgi:hypothetical protein
VSLIIKGLNNANEFYSQHYLDDILESELKSLFDQWKAQGDNSPVARLKKAITGPSGYFRERERFLAQQDTVSRARQLQDLAWPILEALGYELKNQQLILDGSARNSNLDVLALYHDFRQRPLMIIVIALMIQEDKSDQEPLLQEDKPDQDPLLQEDEPDQDPLKLLPCDAKGMVNIWDKNNLDWENTLTRVVFRADAPPRWVLLVHHEQWLLIDRTKWDRKAVLRFDLPELFGSKDESSLRAFTALIGRGSVIPARQGGKAFLDELDDSSHKHAFAVSTDLKYALRECIELIANEALRYKREVDREQIFEREELAHQLSSESLRYIYRLLFIFYVEARPELKYAPINAETYLSGYSIEHLRDLEQTLLTTDPARNGWYFHESLQILFDLIWNGFPKEQKRPASPDYSG